MTIAKYYHQETRKCVDPDMNVIIDLSPNMIGMNFGIPMKEEVLVTAEEKSTFIFVKNLSNYKMHINEAWLKEPRKTRLKATDILRDDL